MVDEKKLWKPVFKFIKKQFNCFNDIEDSINRGPRGVGIADVAGIRDVGGWQSGDIELITVEVKITTSGFGKKLGEAFGYSVYSHRCYLACLLSKGTFFTNTQKDMAAKIGVGLIEIRKKGGTYKCKEITTAPYHNPINHLFEDFCWNLKFVRCSLCGTWDNKDNFQGNFNGSKGYRWLKEFDKNQDRLKEMLWEKKDKFFKRFYLCKNCKNKVLTE